MYNIVAQQESMQLLMQIPVVIEQSSDLLYFDNATNSNIYKNNSVITNTTTTT
ncbi:hypothetical protein I4U23_028184 [Adineta vaga]|nr:hypothetical protein I4U23_028184 [Adineta vaga]